jgi:hypothetical protein
MDTRTVTTDPGEGSGEPSGEGRWLTYDDLGRVRGIGRESAVKLAQRKRWRRVPGNDGIARVLVPPEWLTLAKEPSPEVSPEPSPDSSPDISSIISGFETALATLREAHASEIATLKDDHERFVAALRDEHGRLIAVVETTAKALTERMEQTLAGEQGRADRAEQALAGERGRADVLRDRIDTLQAEMTGLRRAEAERQARGLLARLRDAWRGR